MRQQLQRAAGRSPEAMAEEMEATKAGNRLYSASLKYNEVSVELKASSLDTAIAQQQDILRKARTRKRVNLNDLEAVQDAVDDYFTSCRMAGMFPSMAGLAASMGHSRQNLYYHMNQHNDETTKFLDVVRSAMCAVVQQEGLKRNASEALSIFILKNSAGMTDRADINMNMSSSPYARDEEMSVEDVKAWVDEISARYADYGDTEAAQDEVQESL